MSSSRLSWAHREVRLEKGTPSAGPQASRTSVKSTCQHPHTNLYTSQLESWPEIRSGGRKGEKGRGGNEGKMARGAQIRDRGTFPSQL